MTSQSIGLGEEIPGTLSFNDVEVDLVTKRFGDNIAVDNISMSVARGEIFGLFQDEA